MFKVKKRIQNTCLLERRQDIFDEPRLLWNGTLREMSFQCLFIHPSLLHQQIQKQRLDQILRSSLNTTFKKHIFISWQTLFCCNLPPCHFFSFQLDKKNISQTRKARCKLLTTSLQDIALYILCWNLEFSTVPPCNIQEAPGTRHHRLKKNQRYGTIFV